MQDFNQRELLSLFQLFSLLLSHLLCNHACLFGRKSMGHALRQVYIRLLPLTGLYFHIRNMNLAVTAESVISCKSWSNYINWLIAPKVFKIRVIWTHTRSPLANCQVSCKFGVDHGAMCWSPPTSQSFEHRVVCQLYTFPLLLTRSAPIALHNFDVCD